MYLDDKIPGDQIIPGHRAAFCSHKLARSEGTCTTLSVFTSFETNVKFMPKPAFELAGIEKSLL